MINDVSVRAAVPEFSLSTRHNSLHEPWNLILVDVEQLGHFVQIRVFLSVFDNLRGTKKIVGMFFRSSLKETFFKNSKASPAHLSCDGHPVEDVPQDDAHHHFVPQVEDHSFAVVVFLRNWNGHGRRRGHGARGRVLRLAFRADSGTCRHIFRS